MKKFILTLLILMNFMPAVYSVCMLEDSCAAPEISNGLEIDLPPTTPNTQKPDINFLPNINTNTNNNNIAIPQTNWTDYQPSERTFPKTPVPENCIFGVCLP